MNLEKLVAAFVANAVTLGYDSATVAAALVRGAAQMANLKSMTREQFMEGAGRAFDATEGPTAARAPGPTCETNTKQRIAAIRKIADLWRGGKET